MSLKDFAIIAILLLSAAKMGSAQDRNDDSLSFDIVNTSFVSAIRMIEARTGYFFYYRGKDVDSVTVTLQVRSVSISGALDLMLRNTDLHYAIDPYGNIFITRSIAIDTSLADELFSVDSVHNKMPITAPSEIKVIASDKGRGNKVYEIGNKSNFKPGSFATLSGTIKSSDGQPVVGASVQVTKLSTGIATNSDGYYVLTLPVGRHELLIRSIGMESSNKSIILYSNGVLDIELQEEIKSLNEVVITAEESSNVKSVSLGSEKLTIKEIKYIPTVFGEADVLRAVLTLPGVKSVGEASTGFNVRGGAADQNLILFNDATIYNPSHFFGFFSAFNPETISTVELYKSSIPAKYGGRLSSILQVTGREGDSEKIKGSAGIGLLTCRFNVEGPIAKGKTTFVAGGRTTYSNWLFKFLPEDSEFKNSKASFYDVNLNITHHFNDENDISVTGYLSHDESNLNTDTVFRYNNRNVSIKWRHNFNQKLSSAFTYGIDHYDYNNSYNQVPEAAYSLDFALEQHVVKANFVYSLNAKHTLDFGLHSIYYDIRPSDLSKGSPSSNIVPTVVPKEQALETAFFLEDQFTINEKLSLNGGLRYSVFNYLGPQAVSEYNSTNPKTPTNATDTLNYGKGDIINTYHGLDLRFSGRYSITKDISIKVGYATTRQFIHMLSNTVAISPTDAWKLSDPNIKPQYSQQVSLGVYKNFFANTVEVSVEGYGRRIENFLDYKSGAKLLANDHIETEVFATRGKAYGVEIMLRKPKGNFNGWVGYTYSRTLLKTDDPQAGENINKGNYYPANYDKPHDFIVVSNYKLSRRFSFSMNIAYSTGRPVTIPVGMFYYGGSQKTLYSDRNSYRIPDYFRSDISINIEGNHKIKQLTHNSWTIGVYNITGRKNPYSVYFTSVDGVVKGYKLSIFGSAIPFVNYNIRF